MANILYLVHRLPYPPNKGDKVRSYHLLKQLARQHRVFLGTFIDDPDDEVHLETVRSICTDLHVCRLNPRTARLRSIGALLTGEPLTLRYYRNSSLSEWVSRTLATQRIDAAVIFSSAMAQYVQFQPHLPLLVDFVDVDSVKWTQYAPRHLWPLSWLYLREGQSLLAYERLLAARSKRSFFVTDNEAELFCQLVPQSRAQVEAMGNGVDAEYFSPDEARPSPFKDGELPLVFTGAMDYLPNVDAVVWFRAEVFPGILRRWPNTRFYIVGRSPTAEVLALADEKVVVTGTVSDVRPYLQHAAAIVAPLRIARGIQNKILEAMAMAKPVIASTECAVGVDAENGTELLHAANQEEYLEALGRLLDAPDTAHAIGQAARKRVLERYSWDAQLSAIDSYLPPAQTKQQ